MVPSGASALYTAQCEKLESQLQLHLVCILHLVADKNFSIMAFKKLLTAGFILIRYYFEKKAAFQRPLAGENATFWP
jgi:hypothetical protein